MKKFRIRRFIRQLFKENRDKKMFIIDTTKFSEHQNRVIVNELWKKNLLASSRKKNQVISINTHKS
ncbi:hypothetical protein [Enterococcus wangshanyuanii]|uniref:Transposase n=1 Tax=Enterococcus wangshanyuanii TaxID=2005703 RepID=A0ABQ1PTR6_9ENTE|nr:hypothetical protein [Enterococcus wangshanyuanii]GGD03236.1 hypothetical protein GCM10011573_35880 [Enterococcus wangshanyuanii]